MQRLIFGFLFVLLIALTTVLDAEEADTSGGTSGSSGSAGSTPPTLPETQVIGQPETTPTAPTGPGGPGTASVFAGTMFQSPPAVGYTADSATTGSLINIPQIDLPATVSVVTPAMIADQQIIRINDLLRDVPSAVKVDDERRPDAFFLRGFLVTSRDYRKNGFLDPSYTPRDFSNVQRVEILEGPSSVLYGAGQPSGTVNLITKQPLYERYQEGSVQLGSFGLERYTVDSTGPVSDDGSLLYRVNAAYQKNESFRDFGYNESEFAAPAMTWVIDPNTTLTWQGEFANDRRRYDTGVAAINGQLTMPISRFLGEPTDFQRYQDYRQSLVLNHKINDDWSLKIGGSSLFYNSEQSGTVPSTPLFGLPALPPGFYYRDREDIGPFEEQYQSATADLAGNVEIAGKTHHMVFGTEDGWFTSNAFNAASSLQYFTPLVINGNAPTYGNVPPVIPEPLVFNSTFYQADYGLYFQDLIDLTEHWKVLAGIRYDHTDVIFDRSFQPTFGPTKSVEQFDVGTPRVGLIYEPIPEQVSLYGMYSASYDPPNGGPYLETGPLQPEFAQIWECGVKIKATDRLMLTAAGFHIVKENVSVFLPDGFHLEQVGSQRSDGAELSATGKISDRLSVIGNYAYTDTELTDPSPGSAINGQRALGVPYNNASLWTRYNLINSDCRTLGVGLGVVYVGDRLGDYFSPLVLPSYTRWDAGVYYHRNRFDVSFYVENIFDAVYYTSSVNQYEVFPGAPINVKGQLTWRF